MNHAIRACLIIPALLAICPAGAAGQPMPFEDVVRNLGNPDPEVRVSAVRLLRDAKYHEAVVPMAPLVTDPVNEIQLEVIAAQLAFFLVEDLPAKRKVAFVLDVGGEGSAARAFDLGPLAAWPKRPPSELVTALLKAIDDDSASVRLESVYSLGVIAGGALGPDDVRQLTRALDHHDPAVRTGTARVIGRLRLAGASEGLLAAMNDSSAEVRSASMRALGEIGDAAAVKALTDQLNYHGKGAGARSALDALARIAHPSSVPLFTARLTDPDPWLRRAAAEGLGRARHASAVEALQIGVGGDDSEMVRAAMAFALKKLGHGQVTRLVDFLDSPQMKPQIQAYLLEFGPAIVPELLPRLLEPDEETRRGVAEVLGLMGDRSTLAALQHLEQDRNSGVATAATRAVERINLRLP